MHRYNHPKEIQDLLNEKWKKDVELAQTIYEEKQLIQAKKQYANDPTTGLPLTEEQLQRKIAADIEAASKKYFRLYYNQGN